MTAGIPGRHPAFILCPMSCQLCSLCYFLLCALSEDFLYTFCVFAKIQFNILRNCKLFCTCINCYLVFIKTRLLHIFPFVKKFCSSSYVPIQNQRYSQVILPECTNRILPRHYFSLSCTEWHIFCFQFRQVRTSLNTFEYRGGLHDECCKTQIQIRYAQLYSASQRMR